MQLCQFVLWQISFPVFPGQALPPWFFERHNFTRRRLGVDLFSLDDQQAILCRAGNSTGKEAPCCTLWTDRGCNVCRLPRVAESIRLSAEDPDQEEIAPAVLR
eukprot:s585_g14.t1